MAGAVFGEVGVSLSWQAQHFVKFWEIAGAPHVVFFIIFPYKMRLQDGTSKVSEEMTILSSDYPRIILESSLYWRKQFRDFPLTS